MPPLLEGRSFNAADQENRMMSSVLARGRARVLGALILLAGVLVLAGGAGQAHAAGATIWPYSTSLSPSGLTRGVALAVNHDSGNLLAVDSDSRTILQMDESGTPVPFTYPALAGATALDDNNVPGGTAMLNNYSDIAVDNSVAASRGNVYVISSDALFPLYEWVYRLQAFKASGEPLFDVTRPGRGGGLGIAPDGNVWVGVDQRMEELTPAGTPTGGGFAIPADTIENDIASESEFDAAGNIFIYLYGTGRVARRSSGGAFRVVVGDGARLALDPATGNILSTRSFGGRSTIDQYSPDGQLESSTSIDSTSVAGAVALSGDGRTLFYLWTENNQSGVYVLGPAVRRPEADAASGVGTTSATLSGVVRPGGAATTYQFEYGLTKNLGSVAPSVPVDAGSGTDPVTATAALSGLKPQAFYYYRLKATVGGTVVYGNVRSLKTEGPSAVFGGVTDVGPSSASLSGTIDPFDLDGASFHFLVEGVGSPFSVVSAERPVAAGSGPRSVSAPVTGLPPGQRFTVRLIATAGGVIGASAPVSFQTSQFGALAPPEPGRSTVTPYGCGSPMIAVPAVRVREGDVVTLSGSDLGVGGTVLVGGLRATASRWSPSSVSFVVPEVGAGKVSVSVSCGRASNSVELTVAASASNLFRLGVGAVKGSSGAVAVALPGPGTVVSTGRYLAKSTVKVKKAGSLSVQVRLTAAGRRALARSRSGALKVTVRVWYTPAGGSGRTLSTSVSFKRGGSR
jgi:hypothetical protein